MGYYLVKWYPNFTFVLLNYMCMTNNQIKVRSTVYPTTSVSEKQWMKEFNVGRLFFDQPNEIGITYGEIIVELKRNMETRKLKQSS